MPGETAGYRLCFRSVRPVARYRHYIGGAALIDGDRMREMDSISEGLGQLWLEDIERWEEVVESLPVEVQAEIEDINNWCDSQLW